MQAPFNLSENKILDFGSSWRMVSKAPAEAAGLTDRGEIIEGKRADLILIEQLDLGTEIESNFRQWQPVYRSAWL